MAHITDNRVSGIVISMTVNFRALELRKRLLTDFFVSFPEKFLVLFIIPVIRSWDTFAWLDLYGFLGNFWNKEANWRSPWKSGL